MPKIYPFRGIVYNTDRIKDISHVVCPPYDQFGPEQAQVFRNRHENNIVRLIGTHAPPENESESTNTPYQQSADLLQQWLADGVLLQEDQPVIYAYHQDYIVGHLEQKIRKSFIALAGLEEFSEGGIMDHERTFPGPKADRLQLLQTMGASFGQIMMIYNDPENRIEALLNPFCKGTPDYRVIDDLGVLHLLWRVQDEAVFQNIQSIMAQTPCMIADGHHRYGAALACREHFRQQKRQCEGADSFDNVLATFINADRSNDVSLLATHRLIHGLPDFDARALRQRLEMYFQIIEYPAPDLLKDFLEDIRFEGHDGQVFGLYFKGSDTFLLLRLKDQKKIEPLFPADTAAVMRSMDNVLLHEVILEKFLRIPHKAGLHKNYIVYERFAETSLHRVVEEDFQCVFLVNPMMVEDVIALAQAGNLMPQKSTDFYPKLLAGLVGHKFNFV